jgi:hypothetical protein
VTSYFFTGVILTFILILSFYISFRENYMKRTELQRKIRNVLGEIEMAKTLCKDWQACNYPHLCSPISPCIILQWTFRDGEIVNLPWSLLVRGDLILMRPGQHSPGSCDQVFPETADRRSFKLNETYGLLQAMEPPNRPELRQPLPDLTCVIKTTPYIENLQITLDKFLDRPPSIHNQLRHLLVTKCIQQYFFIVIALIVITVGSLRLSGLYLSGRRRHSWEDFLVLNCAVLIPLLPFLFPTLWQLLNLWGAASLETLLNMPQPLMHVEKSKSFQQDLDTPTFELDSPILSKREVFTNWTSLVKGNADLLARSTNIVQVLGSMTVCIVVHQLVRNTNGKMIFFHFQALCFVDKKGILSWPNPTPEKVFFLRDGLDNNSSNSSESSFSSEVFFKLLK